MQEIKDIKEKLADKTTIDSFEGTIVTVYPPKDPSAGQKNAGIHRQGIVVADDGGLRMNVGLLKERMHMDKTSEGMKFRFESTSGEKGMSGLAVSKFTKDSGEVVTSVDVNGSATMYALQGSGQPSSRAQTEQKPSQDNDPELKVTDPLEGADNYFNFYRNVYGKARDNMEGTGADAKELIALTTHYMIGLQQRGALKDSITNWVKQRVTIEKLRANMETPVTPVTPVTPSNDEKCNDVTSTEDERVSSADSEEHGHDTDSPELTGGKSSTPDPASHPASQEELDASKEKEEKPREKNWKKVTTSDGKVVSEMDKDDLIDLCIKVLPFHNSDKPAIKSIVRAAMFARKAMDLSYTHIYDVLDINLQNEYPTGAINAAFTGIKEVIKKEDDQLYFEILKDQATFKTMIESHTPERDEQTA